MIELDRQKQLNETLATSCVMKQEKVLNWEQSMELK